jgi:hypothetical protein
MGKGAVVLLAAVLSSLSPVAIVPCRCEEGPPEKKAPDLERLKSDACASAARAVEEYADWLWASGLRRSSEPFYRRVLHYAPARFHSLERLGYRRKGDAWEPPAASAPRNADGPVTGDLGREIDRRRKRLFAPCAQAFCLLAKKVTTDGGTGADDFWREALYFDPDLKEANEALGNVLADGKWRTPAQVDHRKFSVEVAGLVGKGDAAVRQLTASSGPCSVPRATTEPVRVVDGPRYRVESTVLGVVDVKVLARDCERTDDFLSALLGACGPYASPATRVHVVVSEDQFKSGAHEWADGDERETKYIRGLNGWYLGADGYVSWTTTLAGSRDRLTHKTGESFLMTKFHPPRGSSWLYEGVAYFCTGCLLRTSLSWCVERSISSADSRKLDDIVEWPAILRAEVERGEDPPLGRIVSRELSRMERLDVIKSWSVVFWLIETSRQRFIDFLAAVGTGADPAAAAKQRLGRDLDELDAEWRAWILEVY